MGRRPARAREGGGPAAYAASCHRPGEPARPDQHRVHPRLRLRRRLPLFAVRARSEEHTSELQSLMRISYAVFCLKKTNNPYDVPSTNTSSTSLTSHATNNTKTITIINS